MGELVLDLAFGILEVVASDSSSSSSSFKYIESPFSFADKAGKNAHGIMIDIPEENCYQEDSILFMLYNIKGETKRGFITAVKGFLDFAYIRKTLVGLFPNVKLPGLPNADLFTEWKEDNLEEVREGLTRFLRVICWYPELFNSSEFQNFLATGPLPAKQQAEFLKLINPMTAYNHPVSHVQGAFIEIIKDFEEVSGPLFLKYKECKIQGYDQKGEFLVSRRYKDFVLIKKILVAKFPKIPFDSLPKEDLPDRQTINGLARFLRRINKFPFVYDSVEWQTFIRHTGSPVKAKLKAFNKGSLLDGIFKKN